MPFRRLALVGALLLPVGLAAQSIPKPRPGIFSQTWTRDRVDSAGKWREIYVRNDAERAFTVSSFVLYDCVNTRQDCRQYTSDAHIEPGQSVLLTRIEPLEPGRRWNFKYQYQLRWVGPPPGAAAPSAGTIPAGAVPPGAVVTGPVRRVEFGGGMQPPPGAPVMMATPLESFVAVVPPDSVNGRCQAGTDPSALVMRFGEQYGPTRFVRVTLGPDGAPLTYSDTRGGLRPTPPPDSGTQVIRTSVNFNFARAMGMASNEVDGKPEAVAILQGTATLRSERLGVPEVLIARVVKECRGP